MDRPALGRYFLWPGRLLYVGRGGRSALHQHHLVQLGVSLGRAVRIRSSPHAAYRSYTSFLIDADVPHHLVAVGRRPKVFIWIDPESRQGRLLRKRASKERIQPLAPSSPMGPSLVDIAAPHLSERVTTCTAAAALVDALLRSVLPSASPSPADERVQRACALIEHGIHGEMPTVPDLAAAVFLSPSRLMHLFSEQMGLPIRRYALWQRMTAALRHLARGQTLTYAALEAGFSDAPHFSRTFRQMFGTAPSTLFKNSRFIQATSCYEA